MARIECERKYALQPRFNELLPSNNYDMGTDVVTNINTAGQAQVPMQNSTPYFLASFSKLRTYKNIGVGFIKNFPALHLITISSVSMPMVAGLEMLRCKQKPEPWVYAQFVRGCNISPKDDIIWVGSLLNKEASFSRERAINRVLYTYFLA